MNNLPQTLELFPISEREKIIREMIFPLLRQGHRFGMTTAELIDWLIDNVESCHDEVKRLRKPAPKPEPPAQYCIVRRIDDAPDDIHNRWLSDDFQESINDGFMWSTRERAITSTDKALIESIAQNNNGCVAPFNAQAEA